MQMLVDRDTIRRRAEVKSLPRLIGGGHSLEGIVDLEEYIRKVFVKT